MPFQYPLMDRLGLRVVVLDRSVIAAVNVSVSSDGSTWFEGAWGNGGRTAGCQFQYPLMDRLGLRAEAGTMRT